MLVKAIRLGFYNHKRRKEGSLFHIKSEDDFSKSWMKKMDGKSQPVEPEMEPEVAEEMEPEEGVI